MDSPVTSTAKADITSSRVRVEGDDFGHGESDARKNMMGKAG